MTRFVGRQAELDVLERALDDATRGRAGAVLVAGEPGIGKTRLVEELAARARNAGAMVLFTRAWDGGGAPPYWPVVQALLALADALTPRELAAIPALDAATLAALSPALGRRLGVAAAPPPIDWFLVSDAAANTLHGAAKERALILCFDDLHAADASTLRLLRYVRRASRDSGLLLVGTHRTAGDAGETTRDALADLAREAITVTLGGLDEAAVRAWVGDHVEDPARLARDTAGNPLFIDGVLRARPGAPIAAEVRGAIAQRIGALSPEARALLDAAAVIGRPSALALLARTLGVGFATLLDPASEAVRAGLLVEAGPPGEYTFFHALVREVTYAALSPRARAELHAAAARALSSLYDATVTAHLPELARHHLAAAPFGGAARAVALCHAAGRHAMDVAAFAEAARHFEDAERATAYLEGDSPIARDTLLLDLAEAWLLAGDRGRAAATFEEVAAIARARAATEPLARAALGFARTLEFGAHEPRRLALLEEAAAPWTEDSPLAARVLARLAQELWMVAGEETRRSELAERAIAMAERLGDDDAIAYAINAWLQCVWGPAHLEQRRARAEDLLRLAHRGGGLERRIEAHRWRINVAVEAGEMARAEAAIADYAEVARAMRRPDYLANARMREAMLPQLRGDYDEAVRLAASTRELGLLAGDPQADVVHDGFRTLLDADHDRLDDLRARLPAMREHVQGRARHPIYRANLIRGLLAAGVRDEARVEWERLWRSELEDVSRDMMWPALLAVLAPSCVALDDRPRAERLYEHAAPLASLHAAIGASYSLGSMAHGVGILAAHLGWRAEAIRYLEQAVTANEALGARLRAAESTAQLATLGERTPPPPPERALDVATITEEGALWRIEHAGREARVRGALGLGYLRVLLERPGVEVHAVDLAGASELPRAGALPVIDERARRAYRQRIVALRAELEEAESYADLGRAERTRAEIAALTAEIARAFGLGGKARATGSAAERARTRVTKAIRRAVAAIGEALPELGAHLERSVRTGVYCCYDPEPRSRLEWRWGA